MFYKVRHLGSRILQFHRSEIAGCYLHDTAKSKVDNIIKFQALDSGVTIVGLNSASNKNALSKNIVEDLFSVIDNIKCDKKTRVVVLRSVVPKVFCAGADLKERLAMSDIEVHEFVCQLRALATAFENIKVPVIAAIDGAALGGGLEIALACDLRVSSKDAKLGLVETKLGIFPAAGGTQRLPRIVGPAVAKELIFTGRIITGDDARSLGIVNYSVEQNENGDAAFQKAVDLAQEILPNGPVAVQLAKLAITKGLEFEISSGLAFEESCYARVIPTKDRIEGLKAFNEKRKPVYKGE